jgi:hypothetical protein
MELKWHFYELLYLFKDLINSSIARVNLKLAAKIIFSLVGL